MSPPPERCDTLPTLRQMSQEAWDIVSTRLRDDHMTRRLRDVFETYYLDFTVKEASLMAKRYYYAILRVSEAGEDLNPWFEEFDVMDENRLEAKKVARLKRVVDILRTALTKKISEIAVQDLEDAFEPEVKERIKKLPLSRRKAFYYAKIYVKNLHNCTPIEESLYRV